MAAAAKPVEEPELKSPWEGKESRYPSDWMDKKETLFQADYIDSMYGLRLFLRKDGRKRGLWIFLEEDSTARLDSDFRSFEHGMKEFLTELKKLMKKPDDQMFEFNIRMALKHHFDLFFSHRTEGTGFRFTWSQLRNFIAKAKKGIADEKRKTDVDD